MLHRAAFDGMRVKVPGAEDNAHSREQMRHFDHVTEAVFGQLGRDEPQARLDTLQSLCIFLP